VVVVEAGADEVDAGVDEVAGTEVDEVVAVGVPESANVRVTGEEPRPVRGSPVTSWPLTVAFTTTVPGPVFITPTRHIP